jgi:hypothetical protein
VQRRNRTKLCQRVSVNYFLSCQRNKNYVKNQSDRIMVNSCYPKGLLPSSQEGGRGRLPLLLHQRGARRESIRLVGTPVREHVPTCQRPSASAAGAASSSSDSSSASDADTYNNHPSTPDLDTDDRQASQQRTGKKRPPRRLLRG